MLTTWFLRYNQKKKIVINVKNLIFISTSSQLKFIVLNRNNFCGVKEFGHLGPLYTKPKAFAEEEETFEDERKKSKLPSSIAEDNPVLSQSRL